MNTHRFRRICVFASLGVFLFSCQKKTETDENRQAQQEAESSAVVLPEAGWSRTMAIVTHGGLSPIENALFREFVGDMTARLSAGRTLRVAVWPVRSSGRDTSLVADATLECRVDVRGPGEARWFFSLQKDGASNPVWEYSPESPFEAVYELAEKVAVRTAQIFAMDTAIVAKKRIPGLTASMFERYLDGRACLGEKIRENLDCAVRNFKEVLKADSTFIRAWEGLAESYLDNIRNRWDVNRVWVQLAQDAAFRAMRLDSTAGDVRFLLAQVYVQWGDLRAADREARRALDLDPNQAEAWSLLGDLAVQSRGRYDVGLEAYGRSLLLSPASSQAAAGKSLVQMGMGRYTEAAGTLETALRANPKDAKLHSCLALAHLYGRNIAAARAEIRKGLDSDGLRPFSSAVLAMILASTGSLDEAVEEVTLRVEPYAGGNASLCVSVAAVYALLGRKGLSVQWLEKAVSLGYRDYIWLSNDPNFDGMRTDQRFVELMGKIKTEWRKTPAHG
jgi:adenylate cyclase